ncbi:MAG TPA: NAD-dependent epimerase/dehydratase family protein [Streptosporangiaceae bacterium]
MRVVVLGGTQFIGRRITEALVGRGSDVTVIHRGETEPADWVDCRHLHGDRKDFASIAGQVRALRPDAVIDTCALSRADAGAVLPHLPETRLVLLSSMDVYRAYELLLAGTEGEPLPLTEESPVRSGRYPYQDRDESLRDYEKLDVEPNYLQRGGTVLRLAMIYGEHDPQRREEFILRRVRAGRRQIPVGAGSWLWTRCYVGDVATATLATLETPRAVGQIFNVGEPSTSSMLGWVRRILSAAGHEAALIPAPDASLPPDLWPTRNHSQHLLVDSRKARELLNWSPSDQAVSTTTSVRWHLAHPPASEDDDFSADDRALAAAAQPPDASSSRARQSGLRQS